MISVGKKSKRIESSIKMEKCVLCGQPTEYYYVHEYRTIEMGYHMIEMGYSMDLPLCPGCLDRNLVKDFSRLIGFVQSFHDRLDDWEVGDGIEKLIDIAFNLEKQLENNNFTRKLKVNIDDDGG